MLQAYPVHVVDGAIYSVDGTPLPKQATAVLVILNELNGYGEDWVRAFKRFFDVPREPTANSLDNLSDEELNALIHEVRQPS